MAELDSLIADLTNLVARYPNITGPEFVEACERVAHGYYDDLPDDTATVLAAFAGTVCEGLNEPR